LWQAAISAATNLLASTRKQRQALVGRLLVHPRRAGSDHASWSFVDLDEVFERVTRKNTLGNTNVLTISGVQGLVSQRDYFNKSVASENLTAYTLLHRDEFAYNKSYSAGYPMGAIKPLARYESGVVSSLYICFRFRDGVEADPDFFRHYFEAGMLNEGLSGIAQEGARNHGLLNVGIADFFKLRLHIPGIEEQRRIAAVLNMAEAKEQLVEAQIAKLHDEKRALMQQLLTGKRRLRLPQLAEAEPA
jgi:type I restriction enzyme S subunit